MKKSLLIILAVLFVLTGSQSCSKKKGEKPTVPPLNTFVMESSDFESSNGPQRLDQTASYDHWTHSSVNVLFWQTILTINLVVPVAAYKEALNQTPKWKGAKKGWVWAFTTTVGNFKYTCKLHAKHQNNGEVKWEMFLTQDGGVKDFKWFEGTSDFNNTYGNWLLYKEPKSAQEYIKIEWKKNPTTGYEDIKYTNVLKDDNGKDSFIHYGHHNNIIYNSFYNISLTNKNQNTVNDINIEWHDKNKEGRVKDPVKFLDSDWHCWGVNLLDEQCFQ